MLQLSGEGHKGEPVEKSMEGRHCFYVSRWDDGGCGSAGLTIGKKSWVGTGESKDRVKAFL